MVMLMTQHSVVRVHPTLRACKSSVMCNTLCSTVITVVSSFLTLDSDLEKASRAHCFNFKLKTLDFEQTASHTCLVIVAFSGAIIVIALVLLHWECWRVFLSHCTVNETIPALWTKAKGRNRSYPCWGATGRRSWTTVKHGHCLTLQIMLLVITRKLLMIMFLSTEEATQTVDGQNARNVSSTHSASSLDKVYQI